MHKINFLPQTVINENSKKKRFLVILLFFGLCFCTSIFLLIYINNTKAFIENEIYQTSKELENLKANIDLNKNQLKILEDYKNRQTVYEKLKNKTSYVKLINNVVELLPEQILLNSMKVTASEFILNGYAPSNWHIARVIEDIQDIKEVDKVLLQYIRSVDFINESRDLKYNFEILIVLSEAET